MKVIFKKNGEREYRISEKEMNHMQKLAAWLEGATEGPNTAMAGWAKELSDILWMLDKEPEYMMEGKK